LIAPRNRDDYAHSSRWGDRLLVTGLGIEAAALLDILVVRRAQRSIGGILIIVGCFSLMGYFLLRFARDLRVRQGVGAVALSLRGAAFFAALIPIQISFNVVRLGAQAIKDVFTGLVTGSLIVLLIVVVLLDSFVDHKDRRPE